jgi:hypothetical protein
MEVRVLFRRVNDTLWAKATENKRAKTSIKRFMGQLFKNDAPKLAFGHQRIASFSVWQVSDHKMRPAGHIRKPKFDFHLKNADFLI